MADKPLKEGLTVVTDYQTSGRGQIGNTWESQPGKNLLFSLFLKPASLKPAASFILNMSVCLALADALNEFHPGFIVKWPNDILFDRRKICGVLIENSINGNKLQNSIVGIGLNVNQREFSAPNAVSLAQITGRDQGLGHLLEVVLDNLEQRYLQLHASPKRLKAEYLQVLYGYHQPVKLLMDEKVQYAQVLDVKEGGELLLQTSAGPRSYRFKEIEFIL